MVFETVTSLARGETFGSLSGLVLGTVLLAAVLQTVLRLLSLIRKSKHDDEALKDFPGPPRHWFWGNLRDVRSTEEIVPIVHRWAKKYGPVRRSQMGPFRHNVIVSSPEHVKTILSTGEPKEPQIYAFIEPWIGDGLLISKGKKWARNRRLLTPAFHFEILKPYLEIFSSCTQIMVDKWKDAMPKESKFEMFEHVSLMTLDSLLKCAFSYPSNCQMEGRRNPYIAAVYQLSELALRRIRNPLHHFSFFYYLSYNGHKFRQCCRLVQDYSKNVINARKEENRKGTAVKRKYLDFLDILLEARDADGNGLTDTEIQNEVDTFMFEGHDTTASGLSWFFYNMARHPEYQKKCKEEIDRVLGDRNHVEWDDLGELEYLTMCIKESLRTHPPVFSVHRQITKPITFPDCRTAPAGMWVGIAIYALHHNPKVWPDPETYDPERFTPENCKDRSPHAFTPFSAGPRNCIGQHFAMIEMKTCAAVALKQLDFSLIEGADEPTLYPEIILRAKKGVWLNISERQH